MSSIESRELKAAYERIGQRLASQANMDLATMRDIYESLHTATAEPERVCYAEVDAGGVSALWCQPIESATDRVLVYTHGGGYMVGSMHMHRKLAGHIARAAGAFALVLDFRRAPESPFPAQLDDVEAAYRWLLERGVAAEHIALVGDSGGGGLCTTAVLRLRDRGLPLPAAVMAISPWYDMQLRGESLDSNAEYDAGVQRPVLEQMRAALLGTAIEPTEPLVNPLHADLTGFPPVLLQVGDQETLLDDATRFAERARNHGVDITLQVAVGMQHDFQLMAGRAVEADEAIDEIGAWLRHRLGLRIASTTG
ncbi:acetyl esterase/lipase [Tamaricihabitans halophyticus]|uniref:Acetyl esterase/lipase n=1 Tax=Tamaricihabitans halophyticus TaxID=1262583 RepID=A0A4R2QH07_9PSEU|nr:alpha/beta hydrolase [Tamaricihabitans halophyticus]TCP48523.1 acetyl esterase/lipase [Tamaricihabitans halophyticus]